MVAALFVLKVAKTGATAPTTPLVKPAKRIGWGIEGVGRVRTNAVPASATLATTAIVIRRFIATRVMPPNSVNKRKIVRFIRAISLTFELSLFLVLIITFRLA